MRHLVILLFVAISLSVNAQTVWHVDTGSTAMSPAGKTWGDAFTDFQQALDSAVGGDTIFVSEGIYLPDRGTGNRDSAFYMIDSVEIYGGFSVASDDTLFGDRDWTNNLTILSGELQDDGDSSNNAYRIIVNDNNGVTNDAILNGFTITEAYNTNGTNGGGMYNNFASPTVVNCIFSYNYVITTFTPFFGGGVYNNGTGSTPSFTDCQFLFNVVNSSGTNAFGGAVLNNSSTSPTFTDCTFKGNQTIATAFSGWACGSAMANTNSSTPTINSSVLDSNTANGTGLAAGAAIFNQGNGSTTTLNFCDVSTNSISSSLTALGGAMNNFSGGKSLINNCTFTNNSTGASGNGGAIANFNSGTSEIKNTIIWANSAGTADPNVYNNNASSYGEFYYSLVQGSGGSNSWVGTFGIDSGNNVDTNPQFTDSANFDFSLDTCSPAKNIGNNTYVPGGVTTDAAGNPVIQNGTSDLGSYESSPQEACEYNWIGVTSVDWGTASNWSSGSVPPDGATVTIPDTANQPDLDTTRFVANITIESGASMDLNGNVLNVYGDLSNSGTLTAGNSRLEMIGEVLQSMSGTFTFDTLVIDNNAGVSLTSGSISINDELQLNDGTFTTNNNVTLVSNASSTARLASVGSGVSISGNISVQRYVQGTINNWRFLSSPVADMTLADWNDDFVTSGFTGSDYPTFGFNNIHTYDETVMDVVDSGWVAATNVTNAINTGEGYIVYMGAAVSTIDVVGAVNVGPVTATLDYTSGTSTADDGWNLVGNPLPSPVDFGALTTNAIENKYWIIDHATGNHASWDEDLATGTLGADGNIASSQGFWAHATSSGPFVRFEEADKTTSATEYFGRKKQMFRVKLKGMAGQLYDEGIVVAREDASHNWDPKDTYKFPNADSTLPSLTLLSADGEELTIDVISTIGETTIPIHVNGKSGDTLDLDLSGVQTLTNICLVLKNNRTGQQFPLNTDTVYRYALTNTGVNKDLEIGITGPPEVELTINGETSELGEWNTWCHGDEVTMNAIGSHNNFQWNHGVVNNEPFKVYEGLKTYETSIMDAYGCVATREVPTEVRALPTPPIHLNNDQLETGEYKAYQWYFNGREIDGATARTLGQLSNGVYHVQVTDEYDCSNISESLHYGVTGIEEHDENAVSIYPNPGDELLTVELGSTNLQLVQIRIFDLLGHRVANFVIDPSVDQVLNVETNTWQSGVYVVQILMGEEIRSLKWVKK